ncbi:MAG: DUF1738 domain-containing protein [Planctomycetaceae bacterium]|nr:DUF1738 domain-containing protein [Planctomycetaceae bacterium]
MIRKARRDLYQEVTDRILTLLDHGTVPWRNPIQRGGGDGWPKNLTSSKRYRGVNVFLLAMRAWEQGYASDYWLTFRQAKKRDGQIRKGEKSSLVVFWKQVNKRDEQTEELITIPVLRHYNVFNIDQCEGIEAPDTVTADPNAQPIEPLERAEQVISGYQDRPEIHHSGNRAVYRPGTDQVLLPPPERFESRETYYGTLFHELSHSTGHTKRLNRGLDETMAPFGSPDYGKEELVAEMSAAFLCATAGISPPTIEQSAAYIESWRKVIKGDKRIVVSAAGAAQRSADWILGTAFETTAQPVERSDQTTAVPKVRDVSPPSDVSSRSPLVQRELF